MPEEKTNEIKFTEDEMKELQDLQAGYQQSQVRFGQIRTQQLLHEQQSDFLIDEESKVADDYVKLQDTERALIAKLNEKYGPGTLDPTSGVFVPSK